MFIVMESHRLSIVGINPGKSNDRTAKIAADIFNDGFGIAEIGSGINVKSIFVPMVNGSFYLFKGGTDAFFQLVHWINLKDIAVDLSLEYFAPQVGQNLEWQRKGTNLRFPQWGQAYIEPP